MKKTAALGLNLPEVNDFFSVEHANENMQKLDAAIPKKADLGADGKVLASQLPADIDCGTFDAPGPVAAHNASAEAHRAMVVDGNAVGQASVGELAAHEADPLAHQNIILDGNQNQN